MGIPGWNPFWGCDELKSDGSMPGGGATEWTGGAADACKGAAEIFGIAVFLVTASAGDTDFPEPAET